MNSKPELPDLLLHVLCSLLICLTIIVPQRFCAAVENSLLFPPYRQTVRVGFFNMGGYHMIDENGQRTGYGYDYLQLLREHADWNYVYIGYEMGEQEMFAMLERGDIDMLYPLQYTPERSLKFDYADQPMDISYMILSTLADNTRLQPGDTASYNGMRVGLLASNLRAYEFLDFARENNFSCEVKWYREFNALQQALQNGEVDAIVSSSTRRLAPNETLLEKRNPKPLYAIVRKGDKKLLHELNDAQYNLTVSNPAWMVSLSNKYYLSAASRLLALDSDVRDYLNQLRDTGATLRVTMMPNASPYCSFDQDGNAQGILPDLFAETANRLGLAYNIVPCQDFDELERLIKDGSVDIVLGVPANLNYAEKSGLRVTSPLTTATVSVVAPTIARKQPGNVAMSRVLYYMLSANGALPAEQSNIRIYPEAADAINAVRDGKCDSAYVLTLIAQKNLNDDPHSDLTRSLVASYTLPLCVGVSSQLDHRLFELVSAMLPTAQEPITQQILLKHSLLQPHKTTLLSMFYSYPGQSLVVLLCLLALIVFSILSIIRYKNMHRDQQRQHEINTLLSYICRLNELVVNVNLKTGKATEYYLTPEGQVGLHEVDFNYERYLKNVAPDDLDCFKLDGEYYKGIREAFARHQVFQCEIRCKNKSGQYDYYVYTFQPIYSQNGDKINDFIFYRRNINDIRSKELQQRQTIQEALEAARHASLSKGEFLSRMSHEIRTPLNAIIGYITMSSATDASRADVSHYLHNAMIAARHLLSLINDILDMSSIEHGKMKLADKDFSLSDILEEITTIFQSQVDEKHITLIDHTDQLLETNLIGDALRIKQILMNIVSNAVKFTPAHGKIFLSVEQVLHRDTYMTTFIVRDTGIGMSEEYLKHLFQPFEQESAETAGKYGGSGLGLAISHNLVKMMHGSLEVQSKKGKGTTFFITLPLKAAAPSASPATEAIEKKPDHDHPHLLLVEDNDMNREIGQALLSQRGYTVDTAINGQDAVDKFNASTPGTYQAILMDLQMPVMDGYTATQTIRRGEHPDHATIPIIAVTADVFADDIARVMACGMNDYVSKPIDFEKLNQIIQKATRLKKQDS